MAGNPLLPKDLTLEVVTPEGLLLREQVDEVIAPGEEGYFGVLPGHTPFLSTLGLGEITYRRGAEKGHLTCFWGFAEVLQLGLNEPPFGNLPVPPSGTEKPAFVPNVICHFVENNVSTNSGGHGQPNCQ